MCNKANATGIVLIGWRVETLSLWQARNRNRGSLYRFRGVEIQRECRHIVLQDRAAMLQRKSVTIPLKIKRCKKINRGASPFNLGHNSGANKMGTDHCFLGRPLTPGRTRRVAVFCKSAMNRSSPSAHWPRKQVEICLSEADGSPSDSLRR